MKDTFGRISVDASARTIAVAARPVHLTRKAFDLLLLLLEHRATAVSKDAIYARLWPDTFVAESSLQTLVHEIRQVIDDGGTSTSWIRTVHGIGYSFAGDVHATPGTSASVRPQRPAAWLFRESMRLALYEGENVLVGGLDDMIEVDLPTISRRHARITIGEASTLEDLDSKNGTWLKGERVIEPALLEDGDEVGLAFCLRSHVSPRPIAEVDGIVRDAGATTRSQNNFRSIQGRPTRMTGMLPSTRTSAGGAYVTQRSGSAIWALQAATIFAIAVAFCRPRLAQVIERDGARTRRPGRSIRMRCHCLRAGSHPISWHQRF